MFDYIILAFFVAFIGWRYVRTRQSGQLWFILPLLMVVGLNQGWGTALGTDDAGRAFFIIYRMGIILAVLFAAYMNYRDIKKMKEKMEQEEKARGKQKGQKKSKQSDSPKQNANQNKKKK